MTYGWKFSILESVVDTEQLQLVVDVLVPLLWVDRLIDRARRHGERDQAMNSKQGEGVIESKSIVSY